MKSGRQGGTMQTEDQKALVLTKSALECARRLGLTPAQTATALGVSAGAFAAMKKGERAVDGMNGEAASADAIERIVKRLSVLLGSEETKWRSWLRQECSSLEGRPLEVMTRRSGSLKVAAFLEKAGSL